MITKFCTTRGTQCCSMQITALILSSQTRRHTNDNNNNNNNSNNNNTHRRPTTTEEQWLAMSGSAKPATEQQHIQKTWDGLVARTYQTQLLSQASSETDRARLLAASASHSGDWLHAAPIVSIGLRLSDEATRIAVAHRLGCRACEPRLCLR